MEKNINPLKRYGQNFLIDKNIINKIITEFYPQSNDYIVEIGSGRGAMTSSLFNACNNFIAVEIDKKMFSSLRTELPNLNIINEDFLKVDIRKLFNTNNLIRIIGNIPYNISTPLIIKLSKNNKFISDFLLMLQFDAVKRLTAEQGSKDYNASNIIVNYFFDIGQCFTVAPSSFRPKPNVKSVVVKFVRKKNLIKEMDDNIFVNLVQASFSSRRKTLKNSIQNSIFKDYDFSSIGINFSKRAEELKINDFIDITKFIQSCNNDRTN